MAVKGREAFSSASGTRWREATASMAPAVKATRGPSALEEAPLKRVTRMPPRARPPTPSRVVRRIRERTGVIAETSQ